MNVILFGPSLAVHLQLQLAEDLLCAVFSFPIGAYFLLDCLIVGEEYANVLTLIHHSIDFDGEVLHMSAIENERGLAVFVIRRLKLISLLMGDAACSGLVDVVEQEFLCFDFMQHQLNLLLVQLTYRLRIMEPKHLALHHVLLLALLFLASMLLDHG